MHTTCYFGVIHSILAADNYYKNWHAKYGQQVARANDLMQRERRRWSIVSKSKDGLYLLDADLKHELKREGVVPNLWVFPDKMGIYVNMVGDHNTRYEERGNKANSNLESGDQKTSFRGLPVFEAQSFDVDFTGQPIDLMIRNQQCGEWFHMPSLQPIYIYSADSDKFEKIEWSAAWNARINRDSNPNTNAKNVVNPLDYKGWNNNADDSDILLFRPNQTYRMASAILAKGGRETGSTFHGHHDFMLSDDIVRKVHVGHYTFYSKAVVKRPKNVVLCENIWSQGYVGGEGTDFHSADGFRDFASQGALGEGGRPSLIAVAIPKNKCPKNDVLDITGRFAPSIFDTFKDNSPQITEHYHGSGEVYEALRMDQIDMYRSTPEDQYLTRVKRVNTVCFRGMQLKKVKDDIKPTHLNTGHWGENVYPGCRKVRDGEMTFIKDMDWASKMDLA